LLKLPPCLFRTLFSCSCRQLCKTIPSHSQEAIPDIMCVQQLGITWNRPRYIAIEKSQKSWSTSITSGSRFWGKTSSSTKFQDGTQRPVTFCNWPRMRRASPPTTPGLINDRLVCCPILRLFLFFEEVHLVVNGGSGERSYGMLWLYPYSLKKNKG